MSSSLSEGWGGMAVNARRPHVPSMQTPPSPFSEGGEREAFLSFHLDADAWHTLLQSGFLLTTNYVRRIGSDG